MQNSKEMYTQLLLVRLRVVDILIMEPEKELIGCLLGITTTGIKTAVKDIHLLMNEDILLLMSEGEVGQRGVGIMREEVGHFSLLRDRKEAEPRIVIVSEEVEKKVLAIERERRLVNMMIVIIRGAEEEEEDNNTHLQLHREKTCQRVELLLLVAAEAPHSCLIHQDPLYYYHPLT